MIEERLIVGLVVERWPPVSDWGSVTWRASQVLADIPDVAPWTLLAQAPQRDSYYAGEVEIALYSTETTNYRDNLAGDAPKLWVVLRPSGDAPPVEIVAVTADPAEGEAFTEAGADAVDPVPMPPEVAGVVAAFVAAHHVERPFEKRKRDTTAFEARKAKGTGLDRGPPDHRIATTKPRDRDAGDT